MNIAWLDKLSLPYRRFTFAVITASAAVMAMPSYFLHAADGPVGTVQQPLVGGSLIHPFMREELGLLTMASATGTCSASLLTNEWAITAAHCVEVTRGMPALVAPATVTLTANWSGVQNQPAVQINSFRPLDVAIIRVARPFVVSKSTTGYRRQALDAAPENLQNYKIEIFGRGINQFATGSGATAMPSQSDGQFRVGVATIGRYENNLNWVNYATANLAGGDSGGPSFTTIWSGRVLTGVHAQCKVRCVSGQTCGTWRGPGPAPAGYSPWRWVAATPECADAPVRPIWSAIWQIVNTSPKAPPSPLATVDRIDSEMNRYRPPQYVGQFDHTTYAKQFLYGLKTNGELLWYGHLIGVDRNPPNLKERAVTSANQIPTTATGAAHKGSAASSTLRDQVTSSPAVTLGTQPSSQALEPPKQQGPRFIHKLEGPRLVNAKWQGFSEVIPAGQSGIYGLAGDGTLRWYRHDGFLDGSTKWTGPFNVGSGWNAFKKVFGGADGVLYAIGGDGSLRWYRQHDFANSSAKPQWSGPLVIGSGWGNFVHVFSTGEGIIYAVAADGRLLWYRHRGYLTGANQWDGPKVVGSGWAGFKRVFSASDGMIYAVQPDGTLLWYRHDDFRDGSVRWQGPTSVAAGWGDLTHALARMNGTPTAPVVR